MILPIILVTIHWFLSLLAQSLFLHRIAAHGYYKLSRFEEKLGYVFTFLTQGMTYLSPTVYYRMHRVHHSHADQELDPHSPNNASNFIDSLIKVSFTYREIRFNRHKDIPAYPTIVHEWDAFDNFAQNLFVRMMWIPVYFGIYYLLDIPWYGYFFIIFHALMGPIHGTLVNWCGHVYGYRNYDTDDHSRNVIPIDLVLLGELYQNNHHAEPLNPNFARKPWEVDLGGKILSSYMKLRSLILGDAGQSSPTD